MKRLSVLALAIAAVAILPGAGGASVPRGWQTLPISGTVQNIIPLGWASGRAWFAVEMSSGGFDVWSARIAGGTLTSFVSTKNVGWGGEGFRFGATVCCRIGASSADLATAQLHASGKLGDWTPIPGDPGRVVQTAFLPHGMLPDGSWGPDAGATVDGRTVWLVTGGSCPPKGGPHACTVNGGGVLTVAMCCTAAGKPTDIKSLFAGEKTDDELRLGTDAQGRLWLTWISDHRSTQAPEFVDMQQLDPATLAPVGPKRQFEGYPTDQATVEGTTVLVCLDACRVVYQNHSGAFVWSGGGPPTKLWTIDRRKDEGGALYAAGAAAGGLQFLSIGNKVANAPDDGQIVTAARSSASGRNLHVVASTDMVGDIPLGATKNLLPGPFTMEATPAGFVYLEAFTPDYPGGKARLLGMVLRG